MTSTSGNFSDKTWSGTPMWQIAEELEEQRRKRDQEELRKASTPVAVLNTLVEGDHHICELTLLIPAKAVGVSADSRPDPVTGGFREVKVRGPRRKLRRESLADGFELRRTFHQQGEASVWRLVYELKSRVWKPSELPREDASVAEPEDKEQRLRLAQRPRGTGWSRKKDADFFLHTHSPMAYDPKKMQYFEIEGASNRYVPCDPPHDPMQYPVVVQAGASLVGQDDSDLSSPDRPRTLLLKELVLTGRAMKKPLFFLDQPASCFVLFEGVRGSAASDYCSKNFHTKLLAKLSSTLIYWSDAMMQRLITSILEELDSEIMQSPAMCYDGASMGVAIVFGDRLTVGTLGSVRALLQLPSGATRTIGGEHAVAEEGTERIRVDAGGAEVISVPHLGETAACSRELRVRRPLRPRQTAPAHDQAGEIQRVLDSAPDSFAALGLEAGETVDVKAAKACYRKLALKVHPDKAPEELNDRAKAAFSKIEDALAQVETMAEANAKAAADLHRFLEVAGSVESAVMPRAWARKVLGLEDSAEIEDAEKKAKSLRKDFLEKLGQYADGRLAHADARRAGELIDEALEALQAPAPREGALAAVPVTRALGLRDLKRPRDILSAKPHVEAMQLDALGSYKLALLSSATSVLGDGGILSRIRDFQKQPKTASLVIAQDSAEAQVKQKAQRSACLASSVVSILEVKEEEAPVPEPPVKKARVDAASDKVRCLHILLKHKDLRMAKDPESMTRLRGKTVTRTLAQAERELLAMQRQLVANPNIFHTLSRKHSECDSALQPGQNSGDLGWVSRGQWGFSVFENVLFSLKPYEVSDIAVTPRGLHIVQRIG